MTTDSRARQIVPFCSGVNLCETSVGVVQGSIGSIISGMAGRPVREAYLISRRTNMMKSKSFIRVATKSTADAYIGGYIDQFEQFDDEVWISIRVEDVDIEVIKSNRTRSWVVGSFAGLSARQVVLPSLRDILSSEDLVWQVQKLLEISDFCCRVWWHDEVIQVFYQSAP